MSVTDQVGRIAVSDVDELNEAVSPWDLVMRQVSAGRLEATLDFLNLDGMLLSRERWSRGVVATGATPAGYVAVAGASTQRSFRWCGEEIAEGCVTCGIDGVECDFVVPDAAAHWVVLVPEHEIAARFDDGSTVRTLKAQRLLRCAPGLTRHIARSVDRLVEVARANPALLADERLTSIMAHDLRQSLYTVVSSRGGGPDHRIAKPRELAFRRALAVVESSPYLLSVNELAAEVGVSRKSLERAFRERLGISPKKYFRLHLLSRLHRALRIARAEVTTVTQLAIGLGFTELGRMAGEYRQIFGELPSTTLASDPSLPDRRLGDALGATSLT